MKYRFHVIINQAHCKGCALCVQTCPQGAISISEERNEAGLKPAQFDENADCTGCQQCALMCPDACIEIYREEVREGA
ncbi:MAG: 4Fe-4S dicluster domain-containing protein [Armatimonadota bacterium]